MSKMKLKQVNGGTVAGELATTGAGSLYVLKHNLVATSAPTVDNDESENYAVGSRWLDVSADRAYLCLDKTDGAAVWTEVSQKLLFDAIVAPSGGDYTLPSAAFAAGHKSIFVRSGTYAETTDVLVPANGRIFGEQSGADVTLSFTGSVGVKADASGGTKDTAGTISLTSNSTTVTGSGTDFLSLSPGDHLIVGTTCYPINSITNDTSLELLHAYRGPTESGLSYIAQTMNTGISIENIEITGSSGTGLYLRAIRESHLSNVFVKSCAKNIEVLDCCNVRFDGFSSRFSTATGMELSTSVGLRVTNSHISNNTGDGITFLTDGNGCAISDSFVDSNGGDGIDVQGTWKDVQVNNVSIQRNKLKGINTEPTTACFIVDGSVILANGSYGIDFDGSENIISNSDIGENGNAGMIPGDLGVIEGCHVFNNASHGIALDNDANTIVSNNQIYGNTGDGINLSTSSNSLITIVNNRIKDNGTNGILIPATGADNCRLLGNLISGHTNNINNSSATTRFGSEATGGGVDGNGITGPILHNFGATSDPLVTSDVDSGYMLGSRWVNRSADTHWVCVDNASGAAVWKDTAEIAGAAGGDLSGTYPNPTVNDGADSTAIHDNISAEISAITEKLTPVSADLLLIEDSAASNAKKKIQVGNMDHDGFSGFVANEHVDHSGVNINTSEGIQGGGDITATRNLKLDINGLTAETVTDQNADYAVIYDASAGFHRKVLLKSFSSRSKYDRSYGISESNKGYVETTSMTYEVISRFQFPGTTALGGSPDEAKVLMSRTSTGSTVAARLYDATNAQVIVEDDAIAAGEDPTFTINDLGTVSNLPANEAIFEVQVKVNGGGNKARTAAFHLREI